MVVFFFFGLDGGADSFELFFDLPRFFFEVGEGGGEELFSFLKFPKVSRDLLDLFEKEL